MALINVFKIIPEKTKIIMAVAAVAVIAFAAAGFVLSRSGYKAATMRLIRVEISATNPKTIQTKTAQVKGGKQIKVYLYSGRKEDTVAFELSVVSEDGLPKFPLQRLAEGEALSDRVCGFTCWDKEELLNTKSGILNIVKKGDSVTPWAAPSEERTLTPEPVYGTLAGPSAPTFIPPVSITPAVMPAGVPTGSIFAVPGSGYTATALNLNSMLCPRHTSLTYHSVCPQRIKNS